MTDIFNNIPGPFFAADFDYFRIPREKWELMLTRLRQMGINTLMITVPWRFHQTAPSTVDLSGTTNPRRDVEGLLNLGSTFNFYCILQLGPYTRAGVLGDGIPAWLLKNAADLDPMFPEAVESWYAAASRALTAWQWPDGPVIAIRLENQPEEGRPIAHSKHLTEVAWRIWLRKRYEGIDSLNAAYDSQYHSVNDVAFPSTWANRSTPVERDAGEFLDSVRDDSHRSHIQTLIESGWQIPVQPVGAAGPADLPPIQSYDLTSPGPFPALEGVEAEPAEESPAIVYFQCPIQVDPDPVEVGQGPTWAAGAPIRPDGAVQTRFWAGRRYLWPHTLPDVEAGTDDDAILTVLLDEGGLITADSNSQIKIAMAQGARPSLYRLRLTGEVVPEDRLKISRGRLKGLYRAEDDHGRTDLIFFLDDAAGPLSGFLLDYLGHLLAAQGQTLSRCAALAAGLSETLTHDTEEKAGPALAAERNAPPSYTLAEARRGLREADAALRKAMAAIGDLEAGFDIILDKSSQAITPEPAALSVTIRPDVFEGSARELLIETGVRCGEVVPQLNAAADAVQSGLKDSARFTVEQYRCHYSDAVDAARGACETLELQIARLRLEIANQELPLVLWRIHNQVEEIVESLRWGVLRGR